MILAELLALVALSAGAGESVPGPRSHLTEIESALKSAESTLISGVGCPSVESVLKDTVSGALPRTAIDALDSGNENLRLLFSCRAAASRSAASCEPLGSRPVRATFDENPLPRSVRPDLMRLMCLSDLHDLSMLRARASGSRKKFVAACLEPDASGRRDFLPGRSAEVCALLADGDKDPEAACVKLAPLYTTGLPGANCRGQLAFLAGDEAHCATLGGQPADQELCLAASAFQQRREKPASCAASPVCSALSTGKDQQCSVYEKRALARICRDHYLPRKLDGILASLTLVDRELESAAAAPDSRLAADIELAERLRFRAELFITRLVDAQNPAWSPVSAPAVSPSETRLLALEGAAKGAAHPDCLVNSRPEEILSLLREPAILPTVREALLNAALPWLERLYDARAFASGGPDVCDDLAPLAAVVHRENDAGDIALDLLCKTNYYETKMAGAVIRAEPGVFELCRKRNLVGDRYFNLDSLDKSCRIFAESKGGVDATCAALGPYFDHLTSGATCPRMLSYVSGDETVCPQFEGETARERCEGYVAYRKAGSRDAKACGGEVQCEMLKGDLKGPERRAAEGLARAACGVFGRADVRTELATQLASQAESQARKLAEAGTDDASAESAALIQARALRLVAPQRPTAVVP